MLIPYVSPNLIQYLLFFDLETVSDVPADQYHTLPQRVKDLWQHKVDGLIKKGSVVEGTPIEKVYADQACLYPEFGRIAVASFGIYNLQKNVFFIRSLADLDENVILEGIEKLFDGLREKGIITQLAGFHIEGFDIPFLTKRFILKKNGTPPELNFVGKKPWEIQMFDLLKIWMGTGFGDRYMIKLDLLAASLDIPSSKDLMEGKDVYRYFHELKDLPAIIKYCEKDVIVTANCALKMAGYPLIETVTKF